MDSITKKKICCLYRVSTLGQVEKDDIPMQKQACHEFAEAQGWDIVKEKSEKGVSGFKVSANDRDAIQEIQHDAALGKFDILLVFMFDRLGRKDDETPFVVEWFVRNGIEVWSTQEGQQRFDTHVDKLMNYIRYWQASGESIKTSIRTKTRLGQIVQEGKFRGGTAPFGYKLEKCGRLNKKGHEMYEIMIDKDEAVVVKSIFDKYLCEGYGSQRISNYLSEQGISNHRGTNFTNTTIQHMLKNIAYTGVLRSGESVSQIFPELQIIDVDTFELIQKIIEQRSAQYKERNMPLHTKGQGLLSGNIYCGHCGARLVQTSNKRKSTLANGDSQTYVRIRYVCYNKTRHRQLCDGQTGYTTNKLDGIIEGILHDMFHKIREAPQMDIIESQYNQRVAEIEANLSRAKAVLAKHTKDLNAYKSEIIKVIQGESAFDTETLNELVAESKKNVQVATADVDHFREQLDGSSTLFDDLKSRYENLVTWSDMYDGSNLEAKKMIVAQIIKAVHIRRDYEIDIDFDLDYEQFTLGM